MRTQPHNRSLIHQRVIKNIPGRFSPVYESQGEREAKAANGAGDRRAGQLYDGDASVRSNQKLVSEDNDMTRARGAPET